MRISLLVILTFLTLLGLSAAQEADRAAVDAAVSEYRQFASDRNPRVRQAALEGLYATNHEEIAEIFLASVTDPDPAVKKAAIVGLSTQTTKRTLQSLTQRMWRGSRKPERLAILEAFQTTHPEYAYSGVADLCENSDWELRRAAAELLACYPDKDGASSGVLVPLLGDKEWAVRLAAVDGLAKLNNPESNKAVLPCLEDKDWRVQAAAIRALAAFRRKPAIPALLDFIERADGRLGDDAEAALKDLTGVDLGKDVDRWRKWWETVGPRFIVPTREEIAAAQKKVAAERAGSGSGYARTPSDTKYPPYHGIKTRSRRILFVVDVSSSMAEKVTLDERDARAMAQFQERFAGDRIKIDISRRELIEYVATLKPYVRFNIITFSTNVTPWQKTLLSATPENRNKAIKFLSKLTPNSLVSTGGRLKGGGETQGQTNTFEAINACFSITKEADALRKNHTTEADTVFFLSDGNPTVGRIVEPQMLLDYFETVNRRSKLVFHTISFGNANAMLMRTIAELSGGQYVSYGF